MAETQDHEDGLPLVDLIACALCCVLLMVFAALASRGEPGGGSSTGFALITLIWEFSDDPKDAKVEAALDGMPLLSVDKQTGLATKPSKDLFLDPISAVEGKWSTGPRSNNRSTDLFVEYRKRTEREKFNPHVWEVRLLMRSPGEAIACAQKWTFDGEARPVRVRARLIDQSTEGQERKDDLILPMAGPFSVIVDVELAAIKLRTER